MSIKATSWIWEHSKQKGPKLLMLLAIADRCDDEGVCFPGEGKLSIKARQSDSAAQETLRCLELAGELVVIVHDGIETSHGKTNRYYLKEYRDSLKLETPQSTQDLSKLRQTRIARKQRAKVRGFEIKPPGGLNSSPHEGLNSRGDSLVDTSVETLRVSKDTLTNGENHIEESTNPPTPDTPSPEAIPSLQNGNVRADPAHVCGSPMRITSRGCICVECGRLWYDEGFHNEGKSLVCKGCGVYAYDGNTHDSPDPNMESEMLEWETELCQSCLTKSLVGQGDSGKFSGICPDCGERKRQVWEADNTMQWVCRCTPDPRIEHNPSLYLTAPEAQPETIVVNFRDRKEHWNPVTQMWDDPRYVYIGRANSTYNLPHSTWANPFMITPDQSRQDVINRYRDYIQKQPEIMALETLRGKILVCWCFPKNCHGDVLIELLNGKDTDMGSAKSEASPVPDKLELTDHEAITGILKAWLEASGRIDPKAYAKKGWRDIALAIHRAGITPEQVVEYVYAKRRDGFWADKEITITKVASEIQAWLKTQQPQRPENVPFVPDPDDLLTEEELNAKYPHINEAKELFGMLKEALEMPTHGADKLPPMQPFGGKSNDA